MGFRGIHVRNFTWSKSRGYYFLVRKNVNQCAAEVTLVFDYSDHQLDVDMAEVAIHAASIIIGERVPSINASCRLKDIHLLLADTGLFGKDSMAIIGQNRIDALF